MIASGLLPGLDETLLSLVMIASHVPSWHMTFCSLSTKQSLDVGRAASESSGSGGAKVVASSRRVRKTSTCSFVVCVGTTCTCIRIFKYMHDGGDDDDELCDSGREEREKERKNGRESNNK